MRTAPTMCQLCFFFLLLYLDVEGKTFLQPSCLPASRSSLEPELFCISPSSADLRPSCARRAVDGASERSVAQWGQINDGNALSSSSSTLSNPALTAVRHCDTVLPLPCDRLLTCPASHPVHAGKSVSLLQLLTAQVGTWMDGWMENCHVWLLVLHSYVLLTKAAAAAEAAALLDGVFLWRAGHFSLTSAMWWFLIWLMCWCVTCLEMRLFAWKLWLDWMKHFGAGVLNTVHHVAKWPLRWDFRKQEVTWVLLSAAMSNVALCVF